MDQESTLTRDADRGQAGRYGVSPRRRVNLSLMPETIDELTRLALQFGVARGPVVDKLVAAMASAYQVGELRCVTGRPCPYRETVLPRSL